MEISINLSKPPRRGRTTTLLRCHSEDKHDIDKAADMVGMSTAEYMRTVIIQASRVVIANGGKDGKD